MSDPNPLSFDSVWLDLARHTITTSALLRKAYASRLERYAQVATLRRIINSRNWKEVSEMPMGTPLIHIPVEPEERRQQPEERRQQPDGGSAEFKTLCGQWRQWQNLLGNYRPPSQGRPATEDNTEPTCPRCIKKRG